jgi:hypothetical protein
LVGYETRHLKDQEEGRSGVDQLQQQGVRRSDLHEALYWTTQGVMAGNPEVQANALFGQKRVELIKGILERAGYNAADAVKEFNKQGGACHRHISGRHIEPCPSDDLLESTLAGTLLSNSPARS